MFFFCMASTSDAAFLSSRISIVSALVKKEREETEDEAKIDWD